MHIWNIIFQNSESINYWHFSSLFYHLQGRRERFIKPAIPLPNIGLNTSAPNVLSSSIIPSHHSQNNNFNINNNNSGANSGSNVSLSSLNNSISSSSSSTLPSQSSGHISAFVQPPSPMMD